MIQLGTLSKTIKNDGIKSGSLKMIDLNLDPGSSIFQKKFCKNDGFKSWSVYPNKKVKDAW